MEKIMKLIPLLALVAVGCSSASTEETTTLAPLVTTTVIPQFDTLPGEKVYTASEFSFFDDIVYFYDGNPTLGDEEIDRKMHFSIVLSGIDNLCPDQSDKSEYIALNMPLP